MVSDRPPRQSAGQGANKNPPSSRGGNRGGAPSEWLGHPYDPVPNPDSAASFVEYLRWMRSPEDAATKDGTKVELLTKAEQGNYSQRLKVLTERTRHIAGHENCFEVTCPWRIRVGGHRGPESILLPAFDNLGIPYIPSSTLRGVARTQALRELGSEAAVEKYFGSLNAQDPDRAGKVIFLDAYPLPRQKNGGLAMDIANNLWKWEGNTAKYKANPNLFFSLKECTFLIGLRLASHCSPSEQHALSKVKHWLMQGLQEGIGSQVNTGYGALVEPQKHLSRGFFSVEFTIQGQLIHGQQQFTSWQWSDRRQQWEMRGQPKAEVRATAFKSMLRYWLRAIALGVLEPGKAKELEKKIFGGIEPATYGYVKVQVVDTASEVGSKDYVGKQSGTLILSLSANVPDKEKEITTQLLKCLTWVMFHLGGIGQGARRPCYKRTSNPYFRGSTLSVNEKTDLWQLPEDKKDFRDLFQRNLRSIYEAIAHLSGEKINSQHPQLVSAETVTSEDWLEALDKNCRIVICSGDSRGEKPYGLSLLHDPSLKYNGNYNKRLCGSTEKPSPVWISDLGEYQVITIFGVTKDPRLNFLKFLQGKCLQLFPFPSG
ncbi:RAMP superfamily CRISPR-associated protein [Parathermosynechococcus lividus]